MLHFAEMMIPISFFVSMVLIIYFVAKFNNKTKLAYIEKGGDIEFPKRKSLFLEFGATAVGLGLGLAMGGLFQSTHLPPESKGMLTAASALVFAGAGALVGFFIRRKIDAANN